MKKIVQINNYTVLITGLSLALLIQCSAPKAIPADEAFKTNKSYVNGKAYNEKFKKINALLKDTSLFAVTACCQSGNADSAAKSCWSKKMDKVNVLVCPVEIIQAQEKTLAQYLEVLKTIWPGANGHSSGMYGAMNINEGDLTKVFYFGKTDTLTSSSVIEEYEGQKTTLSEFINKSDLLDNYTDCPIIAIVAGGKYERAEVSGNTYKSALAEGKVVLLDAETLEKICAFSIFGTNQSELYNVEVGKESNALSENLKSMLQNSLMHAVSNAAGLKSSYDVQLLNVSY